MRGTASDPFAALDSQDVQVRRAAADELASRFPSLDEFSLLHDRGQKFEFGDAPATPDPMTKRVTEALADEAFATTPISKVDSNSTPGVKPSSTVSSGGISRTTSLRKAAPYDAKDSPRGSNTNIQSPIPQRVNMVSTGVQTSPRASPVSAQQKYTDVNNRPIWKVPLSSNHNRALSQPRAPEKTPGSPLSGSPSLRPELALHSRPSFESRSKSQLSIPRSPASSRPSLESQRPSTMELGSAIDRSRSANSNARPVSMHLESNLDYLRDREMAPGRNFEAPSLTRRLTSTAIDDSEPEEKNVRSSIDFLRTIEQEEHGHKHRRSSSPRKHGKRGSITNIVKGRFGDAFRRFESTVKTPEHERAQPPLTPTDQFTDQKGGLTPIAGSEATGGLSDDDRSFADETQELSPEMRRELEKRQLAEEERRVEAAAAEYKQRIASQGQGKSQAGPSKASTIQSRVKNLLDESSKPVAASRTAEGYGKYTDTGKPLPLRPQDQTGARQPPMVARKPVTASQQSQQAPDLSYAKPSSIRPNMPPPIPSVSAPPTINPRNPSGPPPRAPKPKALQTGGSATTPGQTSPIKSSNPTLPPRDKPLPSVVNDAAAEEFDVDTFSKRYPSLSGLEMVETEIPKRSVRDL